MFTCLCSTARDTGRRSCCCTGPTAHAAYGSHSCPSYPASARCSASICRRTDSRHPAPSHRPTGRRRSPRSWTISGWSVSRSSAIPPGGGPRLSSPSSDAPAESSRSPRRDCGGSILRRSQTRSSSSTGGSARSSATVPPPRHCARRWDAGCHCDRYPHTRRMSPSRMLLRWSRRCSRPSTSLSTSGKLVGCGSWTANRSVRVVWGEKDRIARGRTSRHTDQLPKHAVVETWADCGHMLTWDAPQRVIDAALALPTKDQDDETSGSFGSSPSPHGDLPSAAAS